MSSIESQSHASNGVSRSRKILFSLVSLLLFWGLCEFTFRAIGFDFSGTSSDLQHVPVFYRIPTVPFGTAYYRRPGSVQWTGKVVTSQMQHIGYEPQWFPQEQVRTLAYDADGFRNPPELKDWEIVMIGDSFTELGNLHDDDLVSTQLGKQRGQPVKNLGISHTGILNQTACLEHFGISDSTQHVIWVFFEGNDLQDLILEAGRISRIETGDLEHVDLLKSRKPQTSLTRAVTRLWGSPSRLDIYGPAVNASFTTADGKTSRFKLNYTPLQAADLGPVGDQFNAAIEKLAELCRQNQLQLWCLYMPTKRRAFHTLSCRLDEAAAESLGQPWTPTDLPQWLAQRCRAQSVRFIDATPTLITLNESGEYSHNLVFDTHLTSAGAAAVADLLAERFKEADNRHENLE
ncbi:MAG: hypothetical protein NZ777_06275 [Pseudomonadales bacterium]|nr:hypothetical protein [Pseudomonadales bacterium]